jgi:ketosteroid isomerase-like protein
MMNFSQAFDFSTLLDCRNGSTPWRNPSQAYADFRAAVARRDADAVIARMTDNYARDLHESRARRDFERDFARWCERYPRDWRVIACCVDGDTAMLETVAHAQGAELAGHVTMVLNGGMWCVGAEHWADNCEHLHLSRLSPCPI